MVESNAGLVDIVREYLDVHERMAALFARFRDGTLQFDAVRDLIADDPRSPLFRLKERCHHLFRRRGTDREPMRRAELFDLAVGSLFHEAMKFRENFYQQVVYAPRMQALRAEVEEDSVEDAELLREFEKIQAAAEARMGEALQETEALVAHTGDQLWILLSVTHEGLITRYLIEQRERVERIHSMGLERLLERMHGDVAAAYTAAGRSYLESAHFGHALAALERAGGRDGRPSPLVRYARGMQRFLAGDYASSLDHLSGWLDAGLTSEDAPYALLAQAAVARIDRLVDEEAVLANAARIAARLEVAASAQPGEGAPDTPSERRRK